MQGFREVKLPQTLDTVLAPSHSRNPTNPHTNLVVNIPKHHTVLCSCFVQQMSPRAGKSTICFLRSSEKNLLPPSSKPAGSPITFTLFFREEQLINWQIAEQIQGFVRLPA